MKEKIQNKPVKQKKLPQREINLVTALKEAQAADKRELKKGRPNALIYVVIVLAVLAMGGLYTWNYLKMIALEIEDTILVAELESPENEQLIEEALSLQMRNSYVKKLYTNTQEDLYVLQQSENQYYFYTQTLFDTVRKEFNGKITVDSVTLTDNILMMDFTCKKASDAAEFAKRLRNTELFEEISYRGFDADEESAKFQLTCSFVKTEEGDE